ncbi:MAG: oligopeptide transporter ATP-binding protein OppF [Pseudomonadota bacterium]|jgi:peptide/nickel transport system ATP-binding protein
MTKPLLQVRNLSLGFSRKADDGMANQTIDALSDISFQLHAGETLALLGESGCGKSLTALALMRLLPGQARFQSGHVLLASDEQGGRAEDLLRVSEDRMRQVRGRRMAMIFQEPATSLNPVMRIGDQIKEVLQLHRGMTAKIADEEVLALLMQVGLPDPQRAASAYPFELSGGMKQRAMIAMALAGDPDILLADEPTTALDVTLQAQILDLIAELQQHRQLGVLLISHDLAVVSARADRVAVMYAGQIVESGPVAQVLNQPTHPYTRALLAALPEKAVPGQALAQLSGRVPPLGRWPMACRFAPRCAIREPHCEEESPPWVLLPGADSIELQHHGRCWRVGDETISDAQPMRPLVEPIHPIEESPVLTVSNLSVRYPSSNQGLLHRLAQLLLRKQAVSVGPVVESVSFDLRAGETLAIVGESGCGKTTTARAILRLIESESGDITLNGNAIVGEGVKPVKGWRRDVQMVFQDPFASLDPRQRIRQVLSEGAIALGLPAANYDQNALVRLLDRVGLPPEALDRFPHEFSGGQRQRIAIARALAVSPKVLICDEPTSALDVSVQAQILNLLQKLQAETGIAYLFITHNFGVVRYLADRVLVMQAGKVVETGDTEQLLARPQHAYTRALLNSVPVLG